MNELNPVTAYTPFSDSDIRSAAEDRLARTPFAARVAELIKSIPDGSDSTVIGVVGPWGGGKTSILNLIRGELSASSNMGIAQFTPWAMSDSSSLIAEFFATLLASHENLKSSQQRDTFKKLAQKLSPALGAMGIVGKAADAVFQGFLETGNWQRQFQELDDLIRSSGVRILITVDDVDRLHGDEVLTLIKTIRMLGRFHNVHYILAYDHNALVDALKPSLGGSHRRASEYLEKIVQYPLDIPPAQESQLKAILDEGLASLFSDDAMAILNDDRGLFQLSYDQELKRFLNTARSVKRFVAQATHYYALVSEHVNVSDFLVLTFLRLHFPTVYGRLQGWRNELTNGLDSSTKEARAAIEELWARRLDEADVVIGDDRAALLRVLRSLFPPAFAGAQAADGARRVCNPEYFDRYFVFGLPEGDISDAKVRTDFFGAARVDAFVEQDFAATFASPSPDVRRLAVSKAEPLVEEAGYDDVPALTRFVIFLMRREPDADPRYMFAPLLSGLLMKHPGFREENEWKQLLSELPGIRSLGTVLDRMHALTRSTDLLLDYEDEVEPEVLTRLRAPITEVAVADLVSLAMTEHPVWRDFMETYAVVSSHGDMRIAMEGMTDAVLNQRLDLVNLATFFVYIETKTTAPTDVLLDIDMARLLTLVSPAVVRETVLAPCPDEVAVGERTNLSWDQRRKVALYGLHEWRGKASEIAG
ncbi:hypothetical protein FHJ30_13020 [Arthrobacter sp. BB-1]|uniref:KAP family P-loop NTPase fold protein n=1 Tax=unclassified Arthrobacter TaxID=235627 RepID=UPI001111ACB8|nr:MULTISPECIES: KAP family NTPase [unclassified Arthrobacter]TNB71603.1 hypothetical protein FHJ30_13020 [Arthrobacter sp. BB-1]